MYIIIGVLILIVILQTFVMWKYQRQIREICRQLTFLRKHDSNMIITNEMRLGGIGELTDILNEFLSVRRNERAEYQKKEKMIADTYTNLSHDIRTPLTSLDGYFQLLEETEEIEEQKRYLGIIQERIRSLKDMLEELFTFTKLKNDSYRLELSDCCMNRILKEAVFSYYDDWMKLGIKPEICITEELLYMRGNRQGLKRIIQNIIKNGLDHGEQEIRISLGRDAERICLQISNPVADPELIDLDQVFERFYKADSSRNKSSTGLGLSIARELVWRMDGKIGAKIEGNLFCVEIYFPCINGARKNVGFGS